jgi:glyoxylase-like metal-dependent hydrolase (beta-lactamase superfamily II)
VFVTHMHPDHVGMAGWITRKFNVRLWMTRLEYLTCRVMAADTGREAPADAIRLLPPRRLGRRGHRVYRVRFGNFGKHIHALPDSYHRLSDGDDLRIGDHAWRGHRRQRPFAGTCLPVLPRAEAADLGRPGAAAHLVERVGQPHGARRRPAGRLDGSLAKLRRLVTDDVLVLPAHNEPFRGLHARLDALTPRPERAMNRLRRGWPNRGAPSTSSARCSRARSPTADVGLLGMATGESMACLNHLLHRGELTVDTDDAGVRWYRMASTA